MPSFIPKCIDEALDPSRLSSGRPDLLETGIPPYVPRMLSCSCAEMDSSDQTVSTIQDIPSVPQVPTDTPPEQPTQQVQPEPPPQQVQANLCVSCRQPIEVGSRFCQYCGAPQQVMAPPPVEVPMNFCAYCGTKKPINLSNCPNCGQPCL